MRQTRLSKLVVSNARKGKSAFIVSSSVAIGRCEKSDAEKRAEIKSVVVFGSEAFWPQGHFSVDAAKSRTFLQLDTNSEIPAQFVLRGVENSVVNGREQAKRRSLLRLEL